MVKRGNALLWTGSALHAACGLSATKGMEDYLCYPFLLILILINGILNDTLQRLTDFLITVRQ